MFRTKLGTAFAPSAGGLLAAAVLLIAAAGCGTSKVNGPEKPVPLTLAAVGVGGTSQAGSPAPSVLFGSAAAQNDTIPVTFTKALLVVRDVRFKLAEDERADTTDADDDDDLGDGDNDSTDVDHDDGEEGEGMIIFRGPFVIDLLAQSAESLDTEMVPPGDYHRVQGHLRALRAGDWNAAQFTFLIGSTVYLQGTVDGEGGGPFTYQARIDDEFMIRGRFTVESETPATAFIVFDISRWLRGRDGAFLDPRVADNDQAIRSAIRHAIKVWMDKDHDGHFEDDMHAEGN